MSSDASEGHAGEVFSAFLKLGPTSFGGPIAHLGYFRDELVVRRKWLDERGQCEPGCALSVSSRASLQPGRLFPRHSPRQWPVGRPCRVVRLHHALRPDPVRLCDGCGRVHGAGCRRFPAWPETRRGRGGRTSHLGHVANPHTRSNPGRHRACRPSRSWFLSPDRSGKSQRSCSARVQAFGSAKERSRRFPDI